MEEIYEKLKLRAVGPTEIALPSLEFVSKVLRKHLGDLGMIDSEPKSQVKNDFVPCHRKDKDPSYSLESLRESKTDILGVYSGGRNQPEITLYVDSCLRASKDLGISPDSLVHIVLIHELAHHATAWAVIEQSRWEDYFDCGDRSDDNWTSVREYFAQALTFVYISEHREGLIKDFLELSNNQPSMYRTWEVLHAFDEIKINMHWICDSLQAQFRALVGKYHVIEPEEMHTVCGYDE